MKRKMQNMYERNRKMIKKLLCGLLVSAMVCGQTVPAWATSKAEKEKQEAQKKLEEANKKAQEAEGKKSAAQNQVSKLTSDLTALLADIKVLESDMANKEAEIKQAELDYAAAKKEEEKQYASMKKRIQYMYEKGDTEYLDIFLQVKNMSDLLNKAEYVEGIYTYDRNMLITYQETKQKVADYKSDLEEDKAEMEVMELEYKEQQSALETLISTKKKEVSNFDSQLAQAKQDAAVFAQTVAKKNEEIRKAKEEEARKKAAEEARKKSGGRGQKESCGKHQLKTQVLQCQQQVHRSVCFQKQRRISGGPCGCGLRTSVCGEPLCIWRYQPDERYGLLRVCTVCVQEIRLLPTKKLFGAALCRA